MVRVSFINVGYGESILIEEFNSKKRKFSMLIDGGNPYDEVYGPEYDRHPGQIPAVRYLHEQGIDTLDLVVLTHFHMDHVGGLGDVLREFRCGEFWSNYVLEDTPPSVDIGSHGATSGVSVDGVARRFEGYKNEAHVMARSLGLLYELEATARAAGISVKLIDKNNYGHSLGVNLSLDIFVPEKSVYEKMNGLVKEFCSRDRDGRESDGREEEDILLTLDGLANETCAALRITGKGGSALLPADLPARFWNPILDQGHSIQASILKFAHHGQEDGISKRLVSAVQPSDVVFCTSEDNPFKSPAPSVFTLFPDHIRFAATGTIPLPPTWKVSAPHRAVVYEIQDDTTVDLYTN